MTTADPNDTTEILAAICRGDTKDLNRLAETVYAELHRLAAGYLSRENPGHVLQTTALVHEAYLQLRDRKTSPGRAVLTFWRSALRPCDESWWTMPERACLKSAVQAAAAFRWTKIW